MRSQRPHWPLARAGLCLALWCQWSITAVAISPGEVADFDSLIAFARQASSEPHRPAPALPDSLAKLDYEQYREIQFKHSRATWGQSDSPFWLEYFHRGFVQRDRIDVFTINRDAAKKEPETTLIPYRPDDFDFGDGVRVDSLTSEIGLAGLKIAGRFEPSGDPQELWTFLGSSYFRGRTGQTVYGASNRGLAINVGLNQPEEFPVFRKFWVIHPEPNAQSIDVLAWLDGPSISGAYAFSMTPGQHVSRAQVHCRLFLRSVPDKLAVAPITSMWMWGDGLARPEQDARPSVHDSDGLLIHADGKWTWRTFTRPPHPSVWSVPVDRCDGFGLLQRDRDYTSFEDSNARYDLRPSVWIQPQVPWHHGRVELLELPGAHEGVDNIGAYWIADKPYSPAQSIDFTYEIFHFGGQLPKSLRDAKSHHRLWTCQQMTLDRSDDKIAINVLLSPPMTSDTMTIPVNQSRLVISTVRGEVLEQSITGDGQSDLLVSLSLRPTHDEPMEVTFDLVDANGQSIAERFATLVPNEQPVFVYPDVYTRKESEAARRSSRENGNSSHEDEK
ncbi:MAG: glucan biosynthesis protein [Planctomycetota bacterium]